MGRLSSFERLIVMNFMNAGAMFNKYWKCSFKILLKVSIFIKIDAIVMVFDGGIKDCLIEILWFFDWKVSDFKLKIFIQKLWIINGNFLFKILNNFKNYRKNKTFKKFIKNPQILSKLFKNSQLKPPLIVLFL